MTLVTVRLRSSQKKFRVTALIGNEEAAKRLAKTDKLLDLGRRQLKDVLEMTLAQFDNSTAKFREFLALVVDHRKKALGSESATIHSYEIRQRKDKPGVDLISDALPFGWLWYDTPDDAISYANFYSRSHDAVIRVYDAVGNVIETHEHKGDFKEW